MRGRGTTMRSMSGYLDETELASRATGALQRKHEGAVVSDVERLV
jgi:hypothetical protein